MFSADSKTNRWRRPNTHVSLGGDSQAGRRQEEDDGQIKKRLTSICDGRCRRRRQARGLLRSTIYDVFRQKNSRLLVQQKGGIRPSSSPADRLT